MNITNLSLGLTGDDILSIYDEFVSVDGLTIDKVAIADEISIVGTLKKGFNINFQVNIKLTSFENDIIAAEITKFKVLNIGIISVVRKLALKYVLKEFRDKGIVYNKGKVEIEYRYLLKDVPYIDFHIESVYCFSSTINVELKNIEISAKGMLNKDVKLLIRDEGKEQIDETEVDEKIEKIEDGYTYGRGKVAEKIPDKAKKYSDYIFILPDLIALIYRLLKDKRVKTKTKLVVAAAMAYVAVPTDIIPDKIPFVGKIDDIGVVFFALNKIMKDVPTKVLIENWQGKNDIILVLRTLVDYVTNFTAAKNVDTIYGVIEELVTL